MQSNLTTEEKAAAFDAAFNTSFVGWAIVDSDFKFRAVNLQWLELLEALPSEFIGRSFSDITLLSDLSEDEANANLVKDGIISSYIMKKTYCFRNGQKKKVILLVSRVPHELDKPFMFFISRILLQDKPSKPGPTSLLREKVLPFIKNYWVWMASSSAVITGVIIGLFQ